MNFDAQTRAYGQPLQELISVDRLPELGPGTADSSRRDQLAALSPADLFPGRSITSQTAASCCLSGLWLWYDFLDESHDISQTISDASGSFLHGIMHRREPDYSNAKYWFRRVGEHAAYVRLYELVEELHVSSPTAVTSQLVENGRWDPLQFVDLCAKHDNSGTEDEHSCREIARAEWFALFDHCFHAACS